MHSINFTSGLATIKVSPIGGINNRVEISNRDGFAWSTVVRARCPHQAACDGMRHAIENSGEHATGLLATCEHDAQYNPLISEAL